MADLPSYGDALNARWYGQPGNLLTPPGASGPDWADAYSSTKNALTDWMTKQRAISVAQGKMDPNTGLPTQAGWVDAAGSWANALLAGTISPRLHAGLPLEYKLDPTAPGFEDRVSTRTPSETQAPDVWTNPDYLVGAESFNNSTGGKKVPYQQRVADIIAQQPGFERYQNGNYLDPSEVHEAFTNHLVENLRRLHAEVANTDWGPDAAGWYDGANQLALATAKQFGILPRQAAGMLARLSPGTPWDQNVAHYLRTLDIGTNQAGTSITPEMQALYDTKYAPETLPDGEANPNYKPKWATTLQALNAKNPDGTTVTLNDLHGENAGMWVRLYDEAHNPDYATFHMVNPDGTMGAPMAGTYSPNTASNIGDALAIMRDGRLANISEVLGEGHKIRSFHNNIISPNAGGDITVDTHAMAAANLMPWGAGRPEVAYGFGNSPQKPFPPHPSGPGATWLTGANGGAATGSDGLYPLYAEAYRRLADELGILPRQLQSMTWEGIKGLYEPGARRGKLGATILNTNSNLWRDYERGDKSLSDVQDAILARGIKRPQWAGGSGVAPEASE